LKCGADYHSGVRASETSGENKVGTGFLSRYAITFDCLRNTAYFAPNRSFRPRKSVGIIAHRKSDGMIIEAVKPGSPADRAGVRPQDKLTAVAGTVVHRQPTAEIMSLIQEGASSDGDVKLTVDRGGVVEVLILKLD
jgi:predicted metalloprotease with PDZ domain